MPNSNVNHRRSLRTSRLLRNRLGFEVLEPRLAFALVVPAFSSLPGADHTIYLDFDGHVTTGTAWNNGATINSPAYDTDFDAANFSGSELQVIENTYLRVAEDFAPFRVNVTTVAPSIEQLRKSSSTDTQWGIRVVITRDVALNCGCGGIAYINSFNWSSDTPAFVFNTTEIGVAEAVSHEVGHTLGLSHDGTNSLAYYQGHGLGTDGDYWSSIMGVGYYVDVSQWDRGEYTGSNNGGRGANYGRGPDDLVIMTTVNGFGYKADDHGNSLLNATGLTIVGNALSGKGLISTRSDIDYFRFSTGAGRVTLNVNPAAVGANLDIRASLYDSAGVLVQSSNPLQSLNASLSTIVAAGDYYLQVEGVGAGTPTAAVPTGYTDYASLGAYTVSGLISAPLGDALTLTATDANKVEGNSASSQFRFLVSRTGDTTRTSTVNYAVSGIGASPATANDFPGNLFPSGTVTFAPGVTSRIVNIYVKGEVLVENNESFRVSLQNPSAGTTIEAGAATGTILNDDLPPTGPTYGIAATNAAKPEGSGTATTPFVFTITRTGSLALAGSVRYSVTSIGTSPATADDIANGFPLNRLVSFPAGVAAVDITVPVTADAIVEPTETFRVTLASPVGGVIGTSFAHGAIRNDDRAANAPLEIDAELIAVADPLWMFIPPESLTAEDLAVPVTSWINGEAFVGELDHEFLGTGGCGCGNGTCGICSSPSHRPASVPKLSSPVSPPSPLIVESNSSLIPLPSPLASIALPLESQLHSPRDTSSPTRTSLAIVDSLYEETTWLNDLETSTTVDHSSLAEKTIWVENKTQVENQTQVENDADQPASWNENLLKPLPNLFRRLA